MFVQEPWNDFVTNHKILPEKHDTRGGVQITPERKPRNRGDETRRDAESRPLGPLRTVPPEEHSLVERKFTKSPRSMSAPECLLSGGPGLSSPMKR